MTKKKKDKLIELGTGVLAESMLKLAERSDMAADMVDRLLATPEENIKRFKSRISGIKRSRRFIQYRESFALAEKLRDILDDLQAGVKDACKGAELVLAFYQTDEHTLGRCDDSSGMVSDVYRMKARDLFAEYASACPEKEKLILKVIKTARNDGYGIRDSLFACASEYLDEKQMRKMIDKLQELAGKEESEYIQRSLLNAVEYLARQVHDPELFERTRGDKWGMSHGHTPEIARVYLESGDPRTALEKLQEIPADDSFRQYERQELLLEIYHELGDTEKESELAMRIFQQSPDKGSLEKLLGVIGEDKRERVVSNAIDGMFSDKTYNTGYARFMTDVGKIHEAAAYIVDRGDQIDGYNYSYLLPLAKTMKENKQYLAASLVYRALLNSILDRKFYKGYRYAAQYLRKLDELMTGVTDWAGFPDHEQYRKQLEAEHGRKTSFWEKYGR